MSELRALVNQLGRGLDLSGVGTAQRVGQRRDAPYRAIGGFEAECTVSEDMDDELTITESPVEFGAAIADHAFKRPAEVRVRVGWTAAYTGGDVRTVYEQLLSLQATRQPFDVYTGKRAYQNMLIASLRTQTNSGLEYTFLADVVLRQVIRVSTQTIGMSNNIEALADPEGNMPSVQTGTVSTKSVSLSETQLVRGGLGFGDPSRVDLSKPGGNIDLPISIRPDIPPTIPGVPTFPV